MTIQCRNHGGRGWLKFKLVVTALQYWIVNDDFIFLFVGFHCIISISNRMDQNLKNTIGRNFGTESSPIREEDNFQGLISCSSLRPMHDKRSSHVDVLLFVIVLSDLEDKLSRSASLSSLNLFSIFLFWVLKYCFDFFCPRFKLNDFWSYDIYI